MNMREAADLAKVSYATFRRRVEDGTISITKQPGGAVFVDPSEVVRAFPQAKITHDCSEKTAVTTQDQSLTESLLLIEQQLEASQKLCRLYEDQVNHLRRQLDESNKRLDKALGSIDIVKKISHDSSRASKSRVMGMLDKVLP